MLSHLTASALCRLLWCLLLTLLFSGAVNAAELRIAVAANFAPTLKQLVAHYRRVEPGFSASISSGSSGMHFAQIQQGAPFDLFFSADNDFTAALVASGHARADSRHPYAEGVLVLWSADPARIPTDGEVFLRTGSYQRLALANPRLAPYGAAAQALLNNSGIEVPADRLISGQNVGQVLTFIASGNVDVGFIAAAQANDYELNHGAGSRWTPSRDRYPAIIQELVVLTAARHPKAAAAFSHWLRQDAQARQTVLSAGYALPPPRLSPRAAHPHRSRPAAP